MKANRLAGLLFQIDQTVSKAEYIKQQLDRYCPVQLKQDQISKFLHKWWSQRCAFLVGSQIKRLGKEILMLIYYRAGCNFGPDTCTAERLKQLHGQN